MSLQKKAVLFIDLCLVIACLCIGVLAYINAHDGFQKAYLTKVTDDLDDLSMLLDEKYPGNWGIKDGKLYKGKALMEDVTTDLDSMAGEDAITILKGDTRVSTTVKNGGQRATGTKVGADVSTAVLEKGETLAQEGEVLGVPYYTCYKPIVDEHGKRIGILFVGTPSAPIMEIESVFVRNMLLITILVLIAGAAISTYAVNRKMKPIVTITDAMGEMARGNLVIKDLAVDGSDEIAKLSKDTNEMKNKMRELMQIIGSSSTQVATGSKSIADASTTLSQGATNQAASIQELSASIIEIASHTKSSAENAEMASKLADTTKSNAVAGNDDMKKMLSAMSEINTASANISKIIKVIDEIAFQTNILSLNAAVEAARAGQHGKGFAVVAEEVRNLAARSAKAAKETTEMIESSMNKVAAGQEIAHQTADSLQVIVQNVNEINELIASIALASKEQDVALNQIQEGITQVSQVVQANSATSQQSAAASEELSSQAIELENIINRFKY